MVLMVWILKPCVGLQSALKDNYGEVGQHCLAGSTNNLLVLRSGQKVVAQWDIDCTQEDYPYLQVLECGVWREQGLNCVCVIVLQVLLGDLWSQSAGVWLHQLVNENWDDFNKITD